MIPEKATEPRFIVDVNVGRLAKWLRGMGYDTLFPQERGDNELVRIALRENRVLVTRDSGIARRRAVRLGQLRLVHIEKDDLRSQLRQLVQELGLTLECRFSRCMLCNERLEDVTKEQVGERLPPYVFQTQNQFMECRRCQRLYWPGTHWSNMMSELEQVCQEVT
ncbi:MAG: Mut7-C RNAse domain-containing protein [Dehalococcoidia bacterium]